MNVAELNESAYLLFQKIKIAIAIVIIKTTPSNMDVKSYATIFQYKFRKSTKRCNLLLEKEIFYNQLLVLLPAFKTYKTDENEFFEPMDIDDDIEDLSLYQNSVSFNGFVSEDFTNFLCKINTFSQFLDAISETKILILKNKNITNKCVVKILSKFQESNYILNNFEKDIKYYSFISHNLFQYIMKPINIDKIIAESINLIIKLMREYLMRTQEEINSFPGLISIKYANTVLLKCVNHFPNSPSYQLLISTFLQESLEQSFFDSERNVLNYWYLLFSNWRQNIYISNNILNTLFCIIIKLIEHDKLVINETRLKSEKIHENALLLLKKMLCCYYRLQINKNVLGNVYSSSSNTHKLVKINKKFKNQNPNINQWEKILKKIVIKFISKHSSLIHLSWNCLKIIMLIKCKIKSVGYNCIDLKK